MSNFEADRQKVYDHINTLQDRVEACTSLGMKDFGDQKYNETVDLLDELEEIRTYPELAEIQLKAQNLERALNGWLASKGQTTLAISWPKIPLEEL